MSQELVETWHRFMGQEEANTEPFVEKLFETVLRTGIVKGSVTDSDSVELEDGTGSRSTISNRLAVSLFRSVCARLAMIFATASNTPPQLYGGEVEATIQMGVISFEAELVMRNSAERWFTIKKRT